MTEETKNNFLSFVGGIIMGVGVAAPIAAYITKKICDKDKSEALASQPLAVLKNIKEEKDGLSFEFSSDDAYAEPGSIPTEEDINNYDLAIDDEDASAAIDDVIADDERYKDMIQRYNGDMEMAIRMIDVERFEMDQSFGKAYVNWYDEDNVFEEDLLKIDNPYDDFGTANGDSLFSGADQRDRPDIVYIRNEKLGTDYEITRVHGSYTNLVGGVEPIGQANN